MNTNRINKLTWVAILSIILMAYTNACNTDDDVKGKDFMKAKVNGKSWESDKENLIFADNKTGYLFISGAKADETEIITIQIFNFPIKTGTYPLGTGEYETHCFYSPTDVKTYIVYHDIPGASGTLTITRYDEKRVEGKFSFTAMAQMEDDIVQVTDGSFSLENYSIPF